MNSKKNHIDKELFRRYLSDEMTDAERNAFEKELQKNPFEAAAMDGFENVSSSNFENDLTELTKKTRSRKHKNRMPYFAAAATILLLITSGIIWMQLDRQNPIERVSEVKIDTLDKKDTETEEKQSVNDLTDDVAEIEISEEKQDELKAVVEQKPESTKPKEEQVVITKNLNFDAVENDIAINNLADNEVILETIPEVLQEQAAEEDIQVRVVTANNRTGLAKARSAEAITLNTDSLKGNIIRGQILSATDGLPLPGVTIVEKGASNGTVTDIDGNFQMELKNDSNPVVASFIGMKPTEFYPEKDSNNIVSLTSDELALNEVVVIGYGSQKKESLTGSTTMVTDEPLNSSAQPVCGMSEYNVYLKKEAVLPANYETDKVVVKLRFLISNSGLIKSFENLNKADEKLFEQAKNIVLNGPGWTPAYKNNRKVESEVRLRVVFKKQND